MVRLETSRRVLRIVLAAAYVGAGIAHLRWPGPFLSITPDWVPQPALVIAATGVAEILGATALVAIPRLRRAAAIGLALYAVCVYPANIKHAIDGLPVGAVQLSWWYHAPRLALQPMLVWWALVAGEVIGVRSTGGESSPPPPGPSPQGEGENLLPPGPPQITPSAFKAAISVSVLLSKPT